MVVVICLNTKMEDEMTKNDSWLLHRGGERWLEGIARKADDPHLRELAATALRGDEDLCTDDDPAAAADGELRALRDRTDLPWDRLDWDPPVTCLVTTKNA